MTDENTMIKAGLEELDDDQEIRTLVAAVIGRHAGEKIVPEWIATEAMHDLDPQRAVPPLVYAGAKVWLIRIAQELLGLPFDEDGEDDRAKTAKELTDEGLALFEHAYRLERWFDGKQPN